MKGIVGFGLGYKKGVDFMLKDYTNADWARSVDDSKSTSGGVFFLGDTLVSWFSKKRDSIYLSMA